MKITRSLLLFPVLALFGGLCANASTVAAVQTANGSSFTWRLTIGADQSATIGWSFVVGPQNLELTALGIYDGGSDGLETPHAVGIWSSAGTLLEQTTIPSGTAAALTAGYRYESVAPLTLTAGQTYFVGAHFAPVADVCGTACGDALLAFGSETFAAGLTFLNSTQSAAIIGDGPLVYPNLNPGVSGGFFGPNFLLTTADPIGAPEPASFTIGGPGLVALLAAARRLQRRLDNPLA